MEQGEYRLEAWEKALRQFASLSSLSDFIAQFVERPTRPRAKFDAIAIIRELIDSGEVSRQQLADLMKRVLCSGSKHVYLFSLEEGQDFERIMERVEPQEDTELLLTCDLPDEVTLLACSKEDHRAEWLFLQTGVVLEADYAEQRFEPRHINYYVHVVLDTTVPWLTVMLEPTEHLRVEGQGTRAAHPILAQQYAERIRILTGIEYHVPEGEHREVLQRLRRVGTRVEHPDLEHHLALIEQVSQGYIEQVADTLGIPADYCTTFLPVLLASWKGHLVQWYQEGTDWSPVDPNAPGYVRRQRSLNSDGTVMETRSEFPLHQSLTHYQTSHLVETAIALDRLEFVWNVPGGRVVRTLMEAKRGKALVSFPLMTAEEDIRYVLSRVSEYHRQVARGELG